ncbi:MAG: YhbY family RNA-binding protein [Clostridia bacterium]|nr:YhbY family RNA-binding protein [Clostridia bacterium]
MFTTKERSKLRSLAQTIEAIAQIGKGGINENMIVSLSEALDKRELIKITVLNNSEDDVTSLSYELKDKLNAEVVCTIGHKIVLYRYSTKKGVKHVEY